MDPKLAFLCYLLAEIAFVIAAIWEGAPRAWKPGPNLVAAGLALVVLVKLWGAWVAL